MTRADRGRVRRDLVHHALDGEIELRPAEAAHRTGRAFVGHDDLVDHPTCSIGSRWWRARACGRSAPAWARADRRRDRPNARGDSRDDAVVVVGRPRSWSPGWARTGRREMLQPVLDPFDRLAGLARGDAQHHDIGKDGELGAERAAECDGLRWRSLEPGMRSARAITGMDRKRALEIGDDVVAAGVGSYSAITA